VGAPSDDGGDPVVILRCADCGDTYPSGGDVEHRCPSCGGERSSLAWEPLL
jgi:rRNA maturation endonuclease Nob1